MRTTSSSTRRSCRARGQSPPVVAVVQLPAAAGSPSTIVTAVYPSAGQLPENTLRLYIEFSAPMGNAGALDFVRLTDERGGPVDIPFLPVQADFWNADHTRYTLFFDPGRVKLGIRPNEELGRPLRAGQTYTLQIAADWRDAQGQPLKAAYRREFRVGPSAGIADRAGTLASRAARRPDSRPAGGRPFPSRSITVSWPGRSASRTAVAGRWTAKSRSTRPTPGGRSGPPRHGPRASISSWRCPSSRIRPATASAARSKWT